jgi:tetratricopeptide (TPR) repeat protein
MVILDFEEIPEERLLEAERLCERAAIRAAKGELPKAVSIYRRVELNPSHDAARRALAMVLMESGKPDDAVDVLLDVLKTRPRDPKSLDRAKAKSYGKTPVKIIGEILREIASHDCDDQTSERMEALAILLD